MSEALEKLAGLPDISFTDNMSLDDVKTELFKAYNQKMLELTGEEYAVEDGDSTVPCLLLCAQAVLDYQLIAFIEKAGKMNFLKYATGDYLDHVGAFKNTLRKQGSPAKVYIKFSLAQERTIDEVIPVGILVTADQKFFFATTEEVRIPAGELSVTTLCTCTVSGSAANDYMVDDIQTLVTPTGFIAEVTNVSMPSGGTDLQSDDELREAIFEAPDLYSVAGKDDEWIVMSKNFNPNITDVVPSTVEGSGVVDVMILTNQGIPSEDDIQTLQAYLSRNDKRPTTTKVHVMAPEKVDYNIEVSYYIAKSNQDKEEQIKASVQSAIDEFASWQSARIGRDINPDELIYRIRAAGAKRAQISSPTFSKITPGQVAGLVTRTVTYGGIEDD